MTRRVELLPRDFERGRRVAVRGVVWLGLAAAELLGLGLAILLLEWQLGAKREVVDNLRARIAEMQVFETRVSALTDAISQANAEQSVLDTLASDPDWIALFDALHGASSPAIRLTQLQLTRQPSANLPLEQSPALVELYGLSRSSADALRFVTQAAAMGGGITLRLEGSSRVAATDTDERVEFSAAGLLPAPRKAAS